MARPSSDSAEPATQKNSSTRVAGLARLRKSGLWRRSLPSSLVLHLALVLALFFLFESRNSFERVDSYHVTALYEDRDEVDSVELIEEVIEATPELDSVEPDVEPELVEAPFVPTVELPPDPLPAEPLDWVPPTDELQSVHNWKQRPAPAFTPPPQIVVEVPPPADAQPPPSGVSAVPEILESPQPRYPRRALRLGWSGTVRLRISVNAAGLVSEVLVVHSSGHDSLDEAAVLAFREWVFRPREAGEPEVRTFEKPFTFRIREH